MKKFVKHINLLIVVILLTGLSSMAQSTGHPNQKNNKEMKTYVIERDIPGIGQFTPEKLKAVSLSSCTILKEMGPAILWDHSYVTGDKLFCVYKAENEDLIRQHAKKGGFPANAIYEVSTVISPATAN